MQGDDVKRSAGGDPAASASAKKTFMSIEDVIKTVKAVKNVDITEAELLGSQPTTRFFVELQGQPQISVAPEKDAKGNTILKIR